MRDFRGFWVLIVVLICVLVLWRVGEKHKTDCNELGKVGCTVLPWSGQIPGSGPSSVQSGLNTGPAVSAGIHNVGSSVSGTAGQSAGSVP